jgi:hypothetical protein
LVDLVRPFHNDGRVLPPLRAACFLFIYLFFRLGLVIRARLGPKRLMHGQLRFFFGNAISAAYLPYATWWFLYTNP